ncbi:MAG: DHH family phosphoesterase [Clostridia bacterium]|nr:DHH family phosphoesterase [Clostridia bacterium]
MVTTYLRAIFKGADTISTPKYTHKTIFRIMKAVNNREKILIYGRGNREGICSIATLILVLRYFNADFDYFLIPKGGNRESLVADAKTHLNFFNPGVMLSLNETFTESVHDALDDCETDLVSIGHGEDQIQYGFSSGDDTLLKNVFVFAKDLSINYDTRNIFRYIDLVYLGSDEEDVEADEVLNMGLNRLKISTNYGIESLKKLKPCDEKDLRKLITPKENPWSMVDNARIIIELLTTEDTNRAEQIAKYLINS